MIGLARFPAGSAWRFGQNEKAAGTPPKSTTPCRASAHRMQPVRSRNMDGSLTDEHRSPPRLESSFRTDDKQEGRVGNVGNIESFSTEGLSPTQRRSFWNELVSNTFTQLQSQPRYPDDFTATLRRAQLGSLSLSQVVSAPAIVSHV